MQKKLTERSLAILAAPIDRAQLEVWDTELRGFGVIVGRTGRKTFTVRVKAAGGWVRRALGVAGVPRAGDGHVWNVALARVEAKKLIGAITSGEVSVRNRRGAGGPTLREGLELHLANMRDGKRGRGDRFQSKTKPYSARSIQKIETEVPRHLGDWLDRPIVELTADELEKVCRRIRRKTRRRADAVNTPGTAQANKIVMHVSAIWNALDRREPLPARNPARGVGLAHLEPRELRIDDGAFADWYAKVQTCSPVRRDLQLVSLFTGIRSDGVRHLRWEDLDEERELLHVRKAKGGKPYALPLVATVRDLLDKRRRENAVQFALWGGDHGWCFPSLTRDAPFRVIPVAEVKERRVDKTQEDEDGDPVRVSLLPGIHANRRTFNSVALELGIPPEARLALMNHEGKGVNVKHDGVPQSWDYLRECAEKIEAALWARIKPAPKAKARGKLRAV